MSSDLLGFAHCFVPASAPRAPTLLLLHGTGGNETDLLDLGRFLAPEAALLSPRGKVMENGMPRFFRRLAPGVFDVADLANRAQELADFVDAAALQYNFDRGRVFAVGFSNGSNVAAALLLLRPEALAGAVLLAPMMPFERDPLSTLSNVPIFIGAGRRDPLVPPENAARLAALFSETGAAVHMEWHSGGHELPAQVAQAAAAWLAKLR